MVIFWKFNYFKNWDFFCFSYFFLCFYHRIRKYKKLWCVFYANLKFILRKGWIVFFFFFGWYILIIVWLTYIYIKKGYTVCVSTELKSSLIFLCIFFTSRSLILSIFVASQILSTFLQTKIHISLPVL